MSTPDVIKLEAEKRETGRSAARTLRRTMRVPAELYGPGLNENIHLSIDELEIKKILSVTNRQIIELMIDDNAYRTLLKDIEFHPVSDRPIHIDLYALAEHHEVSLSVPIKLEGTAVGVHDGGGRVYQPMHSLNIRALPKNIPGEYIVDITDLDIGDNLHVKDLDLKGITPLDELKQTIVTIRPPKSEELLTSTLLTEEPEEEELEAEGEGEETPPEGEQPSSEAAEGEDEGSNE
jgi:large subunit ribosomal protein L25